MQARKFDIVVVGAGHAGIEAALAGARKGLSTLLITLNIDNIGYMSCNPAIGGLAKGQLVRELDALGGEMGKAIDATGTQFKMLNVSKGVAVQSSRAQADKKAYNLFMRRIVQEQMNLVLKQAQVVDLLIRDQKITGIRTEELGDFFCTAAILTPGTFLNGLIHIGLKNFSGGRIGEKSSDLLSNRIRNLGFNMGRFKTGTCPRLDSKTINFKILEEQGGDENPIPFSLSTRKIKKKQIPCYITYTNERTHQIIRDNLDYSPLYTGLITAKGVRYCPSIEDKVIKFPDRKRHHVFLEPEGEDTVEVYPNGLSTSLPIEVQEEMISSIRGLENATIMRPGYGIEHDFINPTQLKYTLETKIIENLYFAGQINGTTGYEEAAVQGFVAGINAAHKILKAPAFIMDRAQSYIGVLIDDLITKGVDEPYRMFTSRAEYRLVLREDNVDLRLREIGYKLGLVTEKEYKITEKKKGNIIKAKKELNNIIVHPTERVNRKLKEWDISRLTEPTKAYRLLKRPCMDFYRLLELIDSEDLDFSKEVLREVEIQIKYEGYVERQTHQIKKFRNLEKINIPHDLDYENLSGLSGEIVEKLKRVQPLSLGQALRIPGVTPAAISIINAWLNRKKRVTV